MPPATPATTRSWVRRRSAARRPSSSGSLIGARYPRDGRHANKRSAPSRMRASQATPGRRGRERSCQAESTSRDPPERQACCARHPHSKDGRLAAPPGTRSPHSLAPRAPLPAAPLLGTSRARRTAGQQRDNRNGSAQPRQHAMRAPVATRAVRRRAAEASPVNPCAGFARGHTTKHPAPSLALK